MRHTLCHAPASERTDARAFTPGTARPDRVATNQTILSAEEDTAEEEEEDAKVAVAGMEFDGNAALVLSTFALVFASPMNRLCFVPS